MSERERGISWRRVLVESIAIVLSILLAFAIDASWDARQDRAAESVLLTGLLADFQATRPDLEQRLDLRRRLQRNLRIFRDDVADAVGTGPLRVADSLLVSALGGPTYDPAINTLDAALASGDIELIRNPEIRKELALWRETLIDTFESEAEYRRGGIDRIEPLLGREIALGPLFDLTLGWDTSEFKLTGHKTLTPTLELSSALAHRVFYGDFATEGLENLLGILDRLVALIGAELKA